MSEFFMPAAFAALVWWFTTGIILFLDGLPPATFRWSMSAATIILLAALNVLQMSSSDMSSRGAYTAFSCAIVVWGWLEMSFLMGFLTGPRRHGCQDRCSGWRHFVHATQAIIYNELATLAGGAIVTYATWHAQNRVALWTYLILWSMRLSAKLNLFLGVPNSGENFLPAHLQYLRSFFRKRAMNFLFPISVSASTIGVAILILHYNASTDPGRSTGYALISTLLGLAVLEHWFMVLPVPSEKLWDWVPRWAPRWAPQRLSRSPRDDRATNAVS